MKETREETYKDVYKFSHRLDEIFEQGMPTKAQIIDAFNKFSGSKHIPTDEIVQKKIFALCSEMRHWDGKSSPKTTPELLNKFWQWMKEYASQSQSLLVLPSEEEIDKRFPINVSMIRPCNLSTRNKWIQQGIMWIKSQLKQGYPKEFVEWWFTKGIMEFAIEAFSTPTLFIKFNEGSRRKYTLDELYQYWKEQIK